MKKAFQKVIRSLISIKCTAVLLFILIPLVAVGSLIPQDRDICEYEQLYGLRLANLLTRASLTSLFTSPLFIVLILILGVNIAGCFLKSLRDKKRSLGFHLVHASLILLMIGSVTSAMGRIRGQVTMEEGQTISSFASKNKTVPLGFDLRLKSFEIQWYENRGEKLLVFVPQRKMPYEIIFEPKTWTAVADTGFQVSVERYVSDFRIDLDTHRVFSASEVANNPAILVHVKGKDVDYMQWVFFHHVDFHGKDDKPLRLQYVWAAPIPKAFISRVDLIEKEKIVREQAVEVNKPLRYKGFSIFQASYDPARREVSVLEIVRDPGTPLVYLGILVIMLGLIQGIYVGSLKRGRPPHPTLPRVPSPYPLPEGEGRKEWIGGGERGMD